MTSVVKGLFGGKSDAEKILGRFSPAGFRSPGLSGSFNKGTNTFSISRGPATSSALRDIRQGFEGQSEAFRSRATALLNRLPELRSLRGEVAGLRPGIGRLRGDIRGLREDVRPGFGRLTSERVRELRGLRDRSVGNLREELSKRRVAGSSFAAREIGALESEFARQEDLVRAESFIQEMDATNQLLAQELGLFDTEAGVIGQQFAMALQEADLESLANQNFIDAFNSVIAGAQTELNQLNLETGIAAELSSLASQLMNQNITAQAEARAAQEVGALNFLSEIIGSGARVAAAGKE